MSGHSARTAHRERMQSTSTGSHDVGGGAGGGHTDNVQHSDNGAGNSLLSVKEHRSSTTPDQPDDSLGHGQGGYTTLPPGKYGSMVDFQRNSGLLLDAIVPQRTGGCFMVKAGAKVVIEELVTCGLDAKLECKRTEHGFEIGGDLDLSIGLGPKNDNIAFKSGVGVKAKGTDAVEAMNLIGLAAEHLVRASDPPKNAFVVAGLGPVYLLVSLTAGDWIANQLWGRDYSKGVLQGMDDEDEASFSERLGLEVTGGVDDAKLVGGLEFQGSEVWKKGEDEDGNAALVHDTKNQLKAYAGLKLKFPPGLLFDIDGSFTFPSVDDTVFKLKVGAGINAAKVPEAPVMGLAIRAALRTLEEAGQRFGDDRFDALVESVGVTFEDALSVADAAGRTYFDVEVEASTVTDTAKVTVRGLTKWSVKEGSEAEETSTEGYVGQILGDSTWPL